MSTEEALALARICVAVKSIHADVFLTVNWKGQEQEGMLLYCCDRFVRHHDSGAPLTAALEFRAQYSDRRELPNAARKLLEFEPCQGSSVDEKSLEQTVPGAAYRTVRIRGCPSRTFYLAAGRVYTSIEGRVKTVLNISLEGSTLPPKITAATLLACETTAGGQKVFTTFREVCQTVPLNVAMFWS